MLNSPISASDQAPTEGGRPDRGPCDAGAARTEHADEQREGEQRAGERLPDAHGEREDQRGADHREAFVAGSAVDERRLQRALADDPGGPWQRALCCVDAGMRAGRPSRAHQGLERRPGPRVRVPPQLRRAGDPARVRNPVEHAPAQGHRAPPDAAAVQLGASVASQRL
jgi:hypothetical protein